MAETRLCPAATLKEGDLLHGFRLTRVTQIPEIRVTAYEAHHLATGAQVLHLHADDRENWYAVAFRTPPADSTGVAHILEHSVLAGSQKYPVKDAFNELGRGSLKTFLNAFTSADFTCYPVASQVRADFYNLASVYSDLVFRPLLKRNTFMQEGHHLELDEEGALTVHGIVYNEMKGAYSSPEGVAGRTTIQAVFPDTPYGFESGGHPDRIPELTYDGFREFHQKYYAPNNARIFLYGDLPTADHLEFLEAHLDGLPKREVHSVVPLQRRWSAPRVREELFPVGPEDSLERKATVNLAWLTAPVSDQEECLRLGVLMEALVGNAAGPLRKALIDSGLGEDISPATGLHTDLREVPLVVGLRGTDPEKAEEIERLALTTLEAIADRGLSPALLEAAFHQVEFKGREISEYRAMELLFRSMGTWLHDLDPIVPLRFPTLVLQLRDRWKAEPDFFSQSIRRWLLDNPHRVRVVARPSCTLAEESEAKLKERLAERKERMSRTELEEVARTAEALLEAQRERESPEALASLPQLRISEIPTEIETIPTEERVETGVTVYEHDLFTNGIASLDIIFDVSDLPEPMQDYLPFLGAAATGMGAAGESYDAFATRKALVTGGVDFELKARRRLRGEGTPQFFVLRASALARNIPRMVGVMRDLLVAGDLTDATRLKDILSEQKNDLRAAVAPRGHFFALRAAASSLSTAGWRDEQWHGAHQLRFLSDLLRRYGTDGEATRGDLDHLRDLVFRRGRVRINLTGEEPLLRALREPVTELIQALPEGGAPAAETMPTPRRRDVGYVLPGRVCHVARVFPAPAYDHPQAPALKALASHLADGYFYRSIRVEGGAYGGLVLYNQYLGQLAFLSYRDPNLEKTLEVYDRWFEAFLEEELDADSVRKAIIGTVAKLEPPLSPASRGQVAFERLLSGLTDQDRKRFREGVLSLDAEALRRVARDAVQAVREEARQAVFAPKERIETANAALAHPFEIEALE